MSVRSSFVYLTDDDYLFMGRKPVKKRAWSEEENEQLRALYEEYKNSEEGLYSCQIDWAKP